MQKIFIFLIVLWSSTTQAQLYILNGSSLTINGGAVTLLGNLYNYGEVNGSGQIQLVGGTPQTINGSSVFNNLAINNTHGVSLSGDIIINGTLSFIDGKLILGANTLILNGIVSGANNSSYIVTNGIGVVKQKVSNNATTIFPIGDVTDFLPVTLKYTLGTIDTFAARTNDFSGSLGNGDIALTKQWEITNLTNTNNNSVDLNFSWPSTIEPVGFNPSQVYIAHYNGSAWHSISGTSDASGSNPRTFSLNGYTGGFSPFTIGYSPSILNIQILDIKAHNYNRQNIISWVIGYSDDSDLMELESCNDGIHYHSLAKVDNHQIGSYSYTDGEPYNGINHYRLKMITSSGRVSFSKTVSAFVKDGSVRFSIYPNPVKELVTIYSKDAAHFEIINVNGKLIRTINLQAGENQVNISDLATGLYVGKYIDETSSETVRFVKQ